MSQKLIKDTHILVIDDNEDILLMLQSMLQFKGYKVSVRRNIQDLETFIIQLFPDVILMDMFLLGGDGREICKWLKSDLSLSRIPVIMISANSYAKAECIEAGALYFLEKPFEMKDLYEAVSIVLS